MKQLFSIFAIVSLASFSALAETSNSSNLSDKFEYKGVVRSSGSHSSGCGAELELIENGTGKIFDLENAEELAQLHCSKEKDFIVSMTAEKTPRFLFWGGNLKVQKFEVLEEVASQPHQPSRIKERTSMSRAFENRR